MSTLRTFCCLSLFFLFVSSFLWAQDYHPFPLTNARWSSVTYSHPEAIPSVQQGFYHEINGDTIIDGVVYQKLFQKYTWRRSTYYTGPDQMDVSTSNDSSSPTLIGAIRQDIEAKKVYYIHFDSQPSPFCYSENPVDEEILIYDFDVEIGDQHVSAFGETTLEQIDFITLANGETRKRYHYDYEHVSIEGIGSIYSLFGMSIGLIEGGCFLRCFRENDVYLIGSSPFSCDSILVVGTQDLVDPLPGLEVFPNPFNQTIQLSGLDAGGDNYQFIISNFLGKEVFRKTIPAQQSLEISVPDLPAGVYIISIIKSPYIRASRKLIKM